MDASAGSLEPLLELAARDDAAGLGDAPWPPHYRKMEGEGRRVAPSRARSAGKKAPARRRKAAADGATSGAPEAQASEQSAAQGGDLADGSDARPSNESAAGIPGPTGRRRSRMPLIVIANSPDKAAALAGLERWKSKYPGAAARLAPDDVLIDAMRGRSSTWTRIRLNLRHVPEEERPAPEAPDPDEDPTREWREAMKKRPRG
jgi:hypothetical protein